MKKAELLFVPAPGIGHLVSILEFATRLLDLDDRFSITILVIKSPFEIPTEKSSPKPLPFSASHPHIRFIELPPVQPPASELFHKCFEKFITLYVDSYKPLVKDAVTEHAFPNTSAPLAGFVVDMLCSSMIDVADELGLPSYCFFTSGAGCLGLLLHVLARKEMGGEEFKEADPESDIPSYINPVPTSSIPPCMFNADGYKTMASHVRRIRDVKGVIINTFLELESHAVLSCSIDFRIPAIYTVGPLIDLKGQHNLQTNEEQREKIMKWLDDQPLSSVVLLCFGSFGTLSGPQLRELALGLEKSEQRFLWSIRRPPSDDKIAMPGEVDDFGDILPDGFLEKTEGKGMICGWIPQVDVLAHKAIGGFVSHCGWNSTLESLWSGVPIAAWPLYAEQQINAFQMVRDLGLAVEMRLGYRMEGDHLVKADEIVEVLRLLMEGDSEMRKRVKEMSEKSRSAVVEGGSSSSSFRRFIEDVLANRQSS